MSDARRTNVTVRSSPQMCSVPPYSLGRWGCLKCRGGRIEFGHLVRHFKHRRSHLHPCTVSHLHNCALTARQPRMVIVSLEGRKASRIPKCPVFGSVTRSQELPHSEIFRSVTNMYNAHSCQGVVEFFWDSY
jgi:hypothetical protein